MSQGHSGQSNSDQGDSASSNVTASSSSNQTPSSSTKMSSPLKAMIEEAALSLPGQSGSQYCCVVGCHNNRRRDGPRGIKFHGFPKDTERRLIWIKAVKRADPSKPLQLWQPKSFDVVCSDHFLGGKKSNCKDNPSYNPTIFPTHDVKVSSTERRRRLQQLEVARLQDKQRQNLLQKKRERHEEAVSSDLEVTQAVKIPELANTTEDCGPIQLPYKIQVNLPQLGLESFKPDLVLNNYCDNISTTEKATQISTLGTMKTHRKMTQTKECRPLTFSAFSDRQVKSFCGVDPAVIKFLASRVHCRIRESKLLSCEMKICLLLVKFKLFVPFPALASMFEIGETTARRIFRETLDAVSEIAEEGVIWFTRDQIEARMPTAFKALYPATRVIIDCSEITCQRPSSARQRVLMYSHYKSSFTVKFLIGIAPSGEVMFVSRGYGGRTTDSEITCNSGFLELIEDGDLVLADKGFPTIEQNVNEAGGIMVSPPFKQGDRQFTPEQNKNAYKCACVRVHVERAIQRLKIFEILNFVPMHMIPFFDRTLLSCCFLINLQNDLIKQ